MGRKCQSTMRDGAAGSPTVREGFRVRAISPPSPPSRSGYMLTRHGEAAIDSGLGEQSAHAFGAFGVACAHAEERGLGDG